MVLKQKRTITDILNAYVTLLNLGDDMNLKIYKDTTLFVPSWLIYEDKPADFFIRISKIKEPNSIEYVVDFSTRYFIQDDYNDIEDLFYHPREYNDGYVSFTIDKFKNVEQAIQNQHIMNVLYQVSK